MRWLVQNEKLANAVSECAAAMGCDEGNALRLTDDALIKLDKSIRARLYPNGEKTVQEYVLELVKTGWCKLLVVEEELRQSVMEYVAGDKDLKGRILARLEKLKYSPGDAEEYYHEGFVELAEKLVGKKRNASEKGYAGEDVKGYFFSICINKKRNDGRLIRPDLKDDLTEFAPPDLSTEETIMKNEQKALLRKWLSELSENCRRTLQMWNDGYSMEEIAWSIPYKDAGEAAVKRWRCFEKLTGLIDYRLWRKNEEK